MEINKVYHGDCLELMKEIPDKSIDMILCDLPYGTTKCSWDYVIPFDKLWEQYNRIIKDNAAIVLTASQPFTSALVMSQPDLYKHSWIWDKVNASNFFSAKFQPLNNTEDVLVFGKGGCSNGTKNPLKYFPQGVQSIDEEKQNGEGTGGKIGREHGTAMFSGRVYKQTLTNYPKKIIKIPLDQEKTIHPTQKPVPLFEYLIRTYTLEGETVLDNTCGSGTTAIACINTGRNYICMEKEQKYYDFILGRIERRMIAKHEEDRQITLF